VIFYNATLKLDDISEKISRSNEKEVGIEFEFSYLEDKCNLLNMVKKTGIYGYIYIIRRLLNGRRLFKRYRRILKGGTLWKIS
jgi:hypothetical protein